MYKIRVYYITGCSFETHEETNTIELDWEDLKVAKSCLSRIETFTDYYNENHFIYEKPKGKLPEGVLWDDKYHTLHLELLTDGGKPYPYLPFWVGYFERLLSAEIICSGKGLTYEPY